MSETEIELAKAYLRGAGHDPVAALIRSVMDLARIRAQIDGRGDASPLSPSPTTSLLPCERQHLPSPA